MPVPFLALVSLVFIILLIGFLNFGSPRNYSNEDMTTTGIIRIHFLSRSKPSRSVYVLLNHGQHPMSVFADTVILARIYCENINHIAKALTLSTILQYHQASRS